MSLDGLMRCIYATQLRAPLKAVLIRLALSADWATGASAWPSQSRIAEDTGLTVRGVRKLLGELVEAGVLVVTSPACHRRPATYRIDTARLAALSRHTEEPGSSLSRSSPERDSGIERNPVPGGEEPSASQGGTGFPERAERGADDLTVDRTSTSKRSRTHAREAGHYLYGRRRHPLDQVPGEPVPAGELAERASAFIARFGERHQALRGSRYVPNQTRDYPHALRLAETYTDPELDALLDLFLRATGKGFDDEARTPGWLATQAPRLEERLKERGFWPTASPPTPVAAALAAGAASFARRVGEWTPPRPRLAAEVIAERGF